MRSLTRALTGLTLVLALAAPVPVSADERGDVQTACVKLGLLDCGCIADDTMLLEAELRVIVLLSLRDEVGFEIRARSGEFPAARVKQLTDFQQAVQAKCTEAQ